MASAPGQAYRSRGARAEYRLDRLAKVAVDRRGPGTAGVVEVLPKGWQVSAGEPNDQGASVEIIVGGWQRLWCRRPTQKRKASCPGCLPRCAPSRWSSDPKCRPNCRRKG